MNQYTKILAVDFDGTIVRSNYPTITGVVPYAKEALTTLHQRGCYIIINTCRGGDDLVSAINYLLEHQIPFDRVNDNHPENIAKFQNNSRKIFAHCYIDDRNLGGFNGWRNILDTINNQ